MCGINIDGNEIVLNCCIIFCPLCDILPLVYNYYTSVADFHTLMSEYYTPVANFYTLVADSHTLVSRSHNQQ